MNKIKYPFIIEECLRELKDVNYPITKEGVYHNLLNTDIINPDGTPTRFAIKNGLVGLKQTDTPLDEYGEPTGDSKSIVTKLPYNASAVQKKIDEQDMDKGVVPFKFVDPQVYKNGTDNGFRVKVDRYVQSSYMPYNEIMLSDLKHKIICDRQNIEAMESHNKTMSASVAKLARKGKVTKAQLINHLIRCCLIDIRNMKHVLHARSQYPIERDKQVNFISAVFSKIIEWQLLPTVDKETAKTIKAHSAYNSRCLLDGYGDEKDTKGLDSLNRAKTGAKFIWGEHIFCNQLNDDRKYLKIDKRVSR